MLAEHQQQDDEDARSRHQFRRGVAPELDELRRSSMAMIASVMEVARHGTPEQARAVTALLDTMRREIYSILARDDAAEPPSGE